MEPDYVSAESGRTGLAKGGQVPTGGGEKREEVTVGSNDKVFLGMNEFARRQTGYWNSGPSPLWK